ncbi:hypothetical protein BJV78DRAFT_1290183 [Lactifluus subvellereus]|nr:hypothetical protein BJV78DRAFT_1290183 [Lactifluus subvellereus]
MATMALWLTMAHYAATPTIPGALPASTSPLIEEIPSQLEDEPIITPGALLISPSFPSSALISRATSVLNAPSPEPEVTLPRIIFGTPLRPPLFTLQESHPFSDLPADSIASAPELDLHILNRGNEALPSHSPLDNVPHFPTRVNRLLLIVPSQTPAHMPQPPALPPGPPIHFIHPQLPTPNPQMYQPVPPNPQMYQPVLPNPQMYQPAPPNQSYGPAAMPAQHSSCAPYFSGLVEDSLEYFLQDYEELADSCHLTGPQKVEKILRYIPASMRDLWKTRAGFTICCWLTFRRSLEQIYTSVSLQSQYSKQKLYDFIRYSTRSRIVEEQDVLVYYCRFLMLSDPLFDSSRLTMGEQDTAFWHGFHPDD